MNWPSATLGEVCQLHYGKALAGYVPKPAGEYPARVFGTNGPIGWTKRALVGEPTIVVGRKGAYRGVHFSLGPSWTIDTAYWVVLRVDRVDLKWFYYRLLLVDINGMNSGAAIPSTRREDFYAVTIRLPDLISQQRIASALAAYDNLIDNNRRRIALLEEAARLLYREWFVYLRFPGHEHVTVVDGVPDGWQKVELGRVLTLKRGYDLPATRRAPGPVPVVSSSGITGYHNQSKASGPGVVTGRYGTLGQVYFVENDYWPLNTALYVSDFKGHDPFFVFQMLKSLLRGVGTQKAAVPGVDRNVLHTMQVVWPSAALRQAFVESVRDNQRQIRVLTAMNDSLSKARDLLLPRLMSGEIAV